MFDVVVTEEQYQYALNQVNTYDFGQRGRGDGTKSQQLTGIIGQTVLADLLGVPRPDGATGFDGGYDFEINRKRTDIKTMSRTVSMRDCFVHNFVGYQEAYPVDYYIFASFNTTNMVLTFGGSVTKDDFFIKAKYYPAGTERKRSDGTTFKTFAPLYKIGQTELEDTNSLTELLSHIR